MVMCQMAMVTELKEVYRKLVIKAKHSTCYCKIKFYLIS
jgi:hypothetical protein